ncbi:hypothetical protein R3P93_17970 [Rhodococcus cerastii]|uniref:Uncharacterized protein n=1 Tax=Rhodococcus cerastii TaxID=908616 RepID=A0ABU4D502_9NOCA|nr:hypothetical protein [Rhodococcus cerastii]MDV6304451.1 hypothetical protein [Rhodococcus cerastii]
MISTNGSRSGAAIDYRTNRTRLKMETPNYGQVAAISNDSHNEGGRSGRTRTCRRGRTRPRKGRNIRLGSPSC